MTIASWKDRCQTKRRTRSPSSVSRGASSASERVFDQPWHFQASKVPGGKKGSRAGPAFRPGGQGSRAASARDQTAAAGAMCDVRPGRRGSSYGGREKSGSGEAGRSLVSTVLPGGGGSGSSRRGSASDASASASERASNVTEVLHSAQARNPKLPPRSSPPPSSRPPCRRRRSVFRRRRVSRCRSRISYGRRGRPGSSGWVCRCRSGWPCPQ
jgi:hypothetical protein